MVDPINDAEAYLRRGMRPPLWQTLGLHIVRLEVGDACLALKPAEIHANMAGGVHGGAIATLIDACGGAAVWTVLGSGDTLATLDLNVTYTRSIACDGPRLLAAGKVVHAGRRVAVVDVRVEDGHHDDQSPIAVGRVVCALERRAG